MSRIRVVLLGLGFVGLAVASAGYAPDGLDRMSRMRDTSEAGISALQAENQRVWEALQQDQDEDTLELIGRWPWAGSFRVRPSWNFPADSIVYLASGSGIRVLKASDPSRPRMIGQVNCRGMLYGGTENGTGFVGRDTFLYVLTGYTCGLEVFSVADPARPRELGNFLLPAQPTGVGLKDTFAIVVGWDSLLRVINVADPRQMRQVASLLLPDEALGLDIRGNYAFACCGHAGLVSVDISNPLAPQQRGQVAGFTGIWVVCDTSRDYAYIAGGAGGLFVINIADPANLFRVGSLASTPTIDIFKCDSFVYLTGTIVGYESDLFVVSIANPAQPRLVGSSRADGWSYSACALSPFSYAYTCDGWEGIHVRSLANPGNPVVDTAMYGAWGGEDIAVQDSLAYYCTYWAGLKVLSMINPTRPIEIGQCDSANRTPYIGAIAVRDSFAFTMWRDGLGNQYFRSIDVTDPRNPTPSGTSLTLWEAKAIVLRDTLAFVAEDYKFEVYNIAHPRQPVRIGACDLVNVAGDLVIRGDYAYVAPSLQVVNTAEPTQPWLASSTSSNSGGLDIVDTFAYCAAYWALEIYSVANPLASRRLATLPIPGVGWDVEVSGSTAYVGCGELEVFDIRDRANPTMTAHYGTPHYVRKIRCASSYVYAACSDGGLYMFRACSTGVNERARDRTDGGVIRLQPNPASAVVSVSLSRTSQVGLVISVRDVAGREVRRLKVQGLSDTMQVILQVADVPDGCYFVSVVGQSPACRQKLVVSKRR